MAGLTTGVSGSTFGTSAGDMLAEARRRARLQGRPVTQQEAAGISEGVASQAANRTLASQQLGLQREGLETQKSQFAQTLANTKEQFAATQGLAREQMGQQASQFGQTLAEQQATRQQSASQFTQQMGFSREQLDVAKTQFGQEFGLKTQQFEAEQTNAANQLAMAKQTLAEQQRQYDTSSAEQKAQFGQQMQFNIQEAQRKEREAAALLENNKAQFTQNMALEKSKYLSELRAAGQPLPESMAPDDFNADNYLRTNPDLADALRARNMTPLQHYLQYGWLEGRSYAAIGGV